MRHALTTLALLAAAVFVPSTAPATTAEAADPVIVVVGDSIVASGLLWDPGRDGFVPRLSARVCGNRCGTVGNATVVNATRGGWLLTGPGGLAEAWPAILAATPAPTTVVVAVGINDVMAGVSDASFTAAYRYLVFSALDAGVRVIPALMAPINRRLALYPYAEPRRAALNGWLSAYWGSGAVANFSDMIRVPWGPQLDYVYDYGDGLHPNPYGTMRLADAVPLDRIV